MITYNTDGVKMPKFHKRKANKWIRAVADTYGRKVGEIGYMFVDDEKILDTNRQYLGHDYYTDIITLRLRRGRHHQRRHCHLARYGALQRREIRQGLRR